MNKDYYNSIAGVTIDKSLDMLRNNLEEKQNEIITLKKEIKELKESNQKLALKNLRLNNKHSRAGKIIADFKRKEQITDTTALEEEIIQLIKTNKRLEHKIELIKELL